MEKDFVNNQKENMNSQKKESEKNQQVKVQNIDSTGHSRQSTPTSQLREPLVQILNDSEFSSPRKVQDDRLQSEKMQFSGKMDFPHFQNDPKQKVTNKQSFAILDKTEQSLVQSLIEPNKNKDTPITHHEKPTNDLLDKNTDFEFSKNIIFNGDNDIDNQDDSDGFYIKDEYFQVQRNFAKSVHDKLLVDQDLQKVNKLLKNDIKQNKERIDSSQKPSIDSQSENIGQDLNGNFKNTEQTQIAQKAFANKNLNKAKKAPRHQSGYLSINQKQRQSMPMNQNMNHVATAQINLKNYRKNAKQNKSSVQVLPTGKVYEKAKNTHKLHKHHSQRQLDKNRTTSDCSVLTCYQNNLNGQSLGFLKSFTQESNGLNKSAKKHLNNSTTTPRIQIESNTHQMNKCKDLNNDLNRKISPQDQTDLSTKKVPMTHRTSSKRSIVDHSRNFNAAKLETKSSLPSLKNLNLDIKSESGSLMNQELLERMSSQKLFDEKDNDNSNNIKVVIRVRPFNQREKDDEGNRSCIDIQNAGTQLILDLGQDGKVFNFDLIADPLIDQLSIFNHIARPIADSCMQGYNGTIFAYGQTGAGKTYTIQGPCLDPSTNIDKESQDSKQLLPQKDEDAERGIMQRSFEYIFQSIQAEKSMVQKNDNGSALQFLVKCSFLEIYNEQIIDLLDTNSISLNIREDINKGVYVEGLSEEIVSSEQDMLELIIRGTNNRHVGATNMNRASSRSHSVLTTIIESKSRSATGVWNLKQSRFHIIDLAGSERQKVAKTVGDRLKEAGMINKSLSALGNVINSLVDVSEGRTRHVPYRDSKLTFILRDSLGGNSKTAIIANISPSHLNLNETLSTLKFAQRAKLIKNQAVINEDSSGTIVLLKNEIKFLKKELIDSNNQISQLQNEKKNLSENIAQFNGSQLPQTQSIEFSQVIDKITTEHVDALVYSQQSDSSVEVTKNENRLSNLQVPSQGDSSSVQQFNSQPPFHQEISQNNHNSLQENIIRAQLRLCKKMRENDNSSEIVNKMESQADKLTKALELQQIEINKLQENLLTKDNIIKQLEDECNFEEDDVVLQYRKEIQHLKEIIKKQIDKEQTPIELKAQAQLDLLNAYIGQSQEFDSQDNGLRDLINSQMKETEAQAFDKYDDIKYKSSLLVLASLEKSLAHSKQEQKLLEIKLKQNKQQIEDVTQKHEKMVEQNMQIDQKCQNVTRDLARAKLEIQDTKQQVKQKEQMISQMQQDLNREIQQHQKTQSEFNMRFDDLKQDHQQRVEQLEQNNNRLLNNIKVEETKSAKALEELLSLNQQEQVLNQQLQQKNRDLEILQNDLNEIITKKDEQQQLWNEQQKSMQVQIEKLKITLSEKNTQITTIQGEIDKLSLLKGQLDTITSEKNELIVQIEEIRGENSSMQTINQQQNQVNLDKTEAINLLNEELECLKNKLEKSLNQIEKLNGNMKISEQKIKDLQIDIEVKQKVTDSHLLKTKKQEACISEKDDLIKQLEHTISNTFQQVEAYKQDQQSKKHKINDLESQIQADINEKDTLQAKIKELLQAQIQTQIVESQQRERIQQLETETCSQKQENKLKDEELSSLHTKYQQETKQYQDQFSSEREQLQATIDSHLLQITQFKKSTDALTLEKQKVEDAKDQLAASLKHAESINIQQEQQIKELEDQLKKNAQKIQDLLSKLQVMQNEVTQFKLEAQAKEMNITQMNAQQQKAQVQNDSLKSEIEKVMDDYQEALIEIQRLKNVEKQQLDQIEDTNSKNTQLKLFEQDSKQNLLSKQNTIDELQSKMQHEKEKYDSEIIELNSQIKQLQSQIEITKSQMEAKVEQEAQLELQISDLKQQAAQTEQTIESQKKEILDKQNQLNDNQNKVDASMKIIKELESHLEQLKQTHSHEIQNHQQRECSQIAEKEAKIRVLNKRIEDFQETELKLKEDIADLESKSKDLNSGLKAQNDLIAKYQTKLEDANDGIQKLQDQLCQSKGETQNLIQSKNLEKLQSQQLIDDFNEQLKTANELIEHQKKELRTAEDKFKLQIQKQERLQSDSKNNAEILEKQIIELKEQLNNESERNQLLSSDLDQIGIMKKELTLKIQELEQQIKSLKAQKACLEDQIMEKSNLIQQQSTNCESLKNQIKDLNQEMTEKEGHLQNQLALQIQQVEKITQQSRINIEQMKSQHLQDVQKAHESSLNEAKQVLQQTKAEHSCEQDKLKKEQFLKQQDYIAQIEQLQIQIRQLKESQFYYEQIVDRIKTSLIKKLELNPINNQNPAYTVEKLVQEYQIIDAEITNLEDKKDNFAVVSNELIGYVSQVVHQLSTLHLIELSNSESRCFEQQREVESLNQQCDDLRKSSNNMSKAQAQFDDERQREYKQYQQKMAILEQERKQFESSLQSRIQLKEKEKQTLKELTQQQKGKINELEREVERVKQKTAEVCAKKEKQEQLISKEQETRKKAIKELENYKSYLNEAENILQEVNKRHQDAQREIERLQNQIEKDKLQHQSETEQQRQEINAHLQSISTRNKEIIALQEKCYNLEQEKESLENQIHQMSQHSSKQQLDVLQTQNQQYAQQIKGLQDEKNKLTAEVNKMQDHIKQREIEMRELVKTIKKFKDQKDEGDLQLAALQRDLQMLQSNSNQNPKVQVHLKMIADNQQLKEENKNLLVEVQKLRKGVMAGNAEPDHTDGGQCDGVKLRKQFNMLVNHLISLPWIDRIVTENKLFIQSLDSTQSHLDQQQFHKILELITLIDQAICNNRQQQSQIEYQYPSTVKAQHSHILRQYKRNSAIVKLHSNESSQMASKSNEEQYQINDDNFDSNQISIDNQMNIKKNDSYHNFKKQGSVNIRQRSQISDSSDSPANQLRSKMSQRIASYNSLPNGDKTLSYIPDSVKEVSQRTGQLSRQDSIDAQRQNSQMNQTQSRQMNTAKDNCQNYKKTNENIMRLDLQRIQRQNEPCQTQSQRQVRRSAGPDSPIILNSYSSIYKHRENSKNSKNSDNKTGISARKVQSSNFPKQIITDNCQQRSNNGNNSKPRQIAGPKNAISQIMNIKSETELIENQDLNPSIQLRTERGQGFAIKSSISTNKHHFQSCDNQQSHSLQMSQTTGQLKGQIVKIKKQSLPQAGSHSSSSVGRAIDNLHPKLITRNQYNQQKRGQSKQNQFKRFTNSKLGN